MKKITATNFYDYTKCKYCVYLEKNGDPKLKDKVSDFVKLLWYRGIQHEETVIKDFIKSKNKSFAEVSRDKPAGKTTLIETINLMKRGVDYIYQGVLMADNFVGRPDLLEKIKGNSSFGEYYYIPVDIKSGRGYEGEDFDNGKVKKSYWLQINFYSLLLGKIQGYLPKFGKIINIDYQELEYKIDLDGKNFIKIKEDISLMAKGRELYQPTISSKCDLCRWKTYCKKWANKRKDLSLLFYVGEIKYGLQNYGINKIEEILKFPLEEWLKKLPEIKKEGHFKGIAEKTFTNLYRRAEVYKQGKEVFYSRIEFPDSDIEIHFDIEDDPTQDITYLFGFWIREFSKNKSYYKYFMAQDINEEEKTVKELWKFLQECYGIPIYHYSMHEISTLRRLQQKYKLAPSPLEQLEEKSIDLYKIIQKYSDWPLTSYGLKSICKFIGFQWSSDDAGGANSIEWFSKFLSGNKEMGEKILEYNKEDCEATAHLKDYIQKNDKFISK